MEEAADLEGVKYNFVKSKLYETRKRFEIRTCPIWSRGQSAQNLSEERV